VPDGTTTRRRSCALLLAGVLCACGSGKQDAPRTRPPPLVVVAPIGVRDVPVEVRAPVELRPLAQADVGSKTLGYLDAVLVDRGDRVKRGQPIALVRPSDLPDQLAAARGTLAQTQASLALARANAERARQLGPSGVLSQQEVQASSASVATAEASEAAAKAQVAALAVRLGETRIESPLDGVVSARRLDPGALVGPAIATPIVSVVRTDVLRVFVALTERHMRGVVVGQEAHVTVDALPGAATHGKVVRVAPTLDPGTRTLDVEVQIDNAEGNLRPGMFGRGAIVLDVHRGAKVLPASAIQITDGKPYAFVLEGDKVRRRKLTLGVDEGTWLEVLDGVKDGEEVVTAGIETLSDGATVRVARGVDPFTGAKDAGRP
jgi:RND family efflux transporter MFP subunit